MGPPSSRLTTCRKVHEGLVCNVVWLAVVAGSLDLTDSNPWTKTLAIGTWNVTSLGGKEPELVGEVERYWLEIVGLISTHSLGSETQLLERGWTIHYSGIAQGERHERVACKCGLAYSSPSQPPCVGVHPGEWEGRFPAPSGHADRSLAVVCVYGPNSSTEYPALFFFSRWRQVSGSQLQ
ncbi:hypothetical protein L3Q82_009684 [Scortum barcoo]|uniref:Uncharacterized protein n=1 Tax=Scortum barcoo TaxID=214431 RepID=A0ACB8WGT7_9TELE|nr:hypothetical protein L3Q82_009684 [Scortum barcoo]